MRIKFNAMKLYRIKDWSQLYENNRTKELKKLGWFPMPNKQDGDGYTLIVDRPDGAAILGAWLVCIQIASRCDPRGTLLRDCKIPHDSASLSRMSRLPSKIIESMLELTSSSEVNWIEVVDYECNKTNPAPACGNPASSCGNPAPSCLEGKERMEGKEGKENSVLVDSDSRSVLSFLNLITLKNFRMTESNLKLIRARLSEDGVTVEGVTRMIERQCELWKDDPKMFEFLRPETLFGKSKFDGYYAAKDLPVKKTKTTNQRNEHLTTNTDEQSRQIRAALERRKAAQSNGVAEKVSGA